MSTLKADAVTSSQDNTALTLSGRGTGGVKVNDFLVQTKGADIGSATSLTLGKDGNQFDVTGTTTITSIATQGIGSYVTLHFDGALTFTHHSTNLILPGGASITTAAGDIAVMYEYASADWRCVSYTKASGVAVVAGGGAWNYISAVTASTSATVDFTSNITSTYHLYMFTFSNVIFAADDRHFSALLDSDGGDSFATSGYSHHTHNMKGGTTSYSGQNVTSEFQVGETYGNASGESMNGQFFLANPADTTNYTNCWWSLSGGHRDGVSHGHVGAGYLAITAAVDAVRFKALTGNTTSGIFRMYGLSNS